MVSHFNLIPLVTQTNQPIQLNQLNFIFLRLIQTAKLCRNPRQWIYQL